MEPSDDQLLADYQQTRNPAPLEQLIRRHMDLVYSAALRQAHDRHLAEDITQGVFVIFAQKAGRLPRGVVLPGWFLRTTRNVTVNAMRKGARRRRHEERAATERTYAQRGGDNANGPVRSLEESLSWEQVAPLVDEAMGHLGSNYHDALVLRFFQGFSLSQVGQALGVSEEAAGKLVSRALRQMRGRLAGAGLACSEAALAAALSSRILETAPQDLVTSVTQAAVHGSAQAAGSGLVQGAMLMAGSVKGTFVVAILVLGGGAVVTYMASDDGTGAVVRTPMSPQPIAAASAIPPAVAQEVRQAIAEIAGAIREGKGDEQMAGLMLAEKPEYEPLLAAGLQATRDGGMLREAIIKRFGGVPDSLTETLPGGNEQMLKQVLPTAVIRMDGDVASVDLGPGSVPPMFVLQKRDGRWRMLVGRSMAGDDPARAKAIAAHLAGASEMYKRIAAEVQSGKLASMQELGRRLRQAP